MIRPAQTARSERTREALRRAAVVRFLAQGVEDGLALRVEDMEEGQDPLPGLFHAQHRLVVVTVYVFVLFQVILPTGRCFDFQGKEKKKKI